MRLTGAGGGAWSGREGAAVGIGWAGASGRESFMSRRSKTLEAAGAGTAVGGEGEEVSRSKMPLLSLLSWTCCGEEGEGEEEAAGAMPPEALLSREAAPLERRELVL
jgi:hypothetical protein